MNSFTPDGFVIPEGGDSDDLFFSKIACLFWPFVNLFRSSRFFSSFPPFFATGKMSPHFFFPSAARSLIKIQLTQVGASTFFEGNQNVPMFFSCPLVSIFRDAAPPPPDSVSFSDHPRLLILCCPTLSKPPKTQTKVPLSQGHRYQTWSKPFSLLQSPNPGAAWMLTHPF